MNRKSFLKSCGYGCLGTAGMAALLQSCTASKQLGGTIEGDDLVVPAAAFETRNKGQVFYKKYIVVQNEILQYPVCIYRFHENEYSALWMRCSHQGTELQVFGDRLQCHANGSEFSSRGEVQNGPADSKLRSFPIVIENNRLRISLKAV